MRPVQWTWVACLALGNLIVYYVYMHLQSVNIILFNVSTKAAHDMTHTIRSVHKTPVFRQVNYFLINDNKLNSSELIQHCYYNYNHTSLVPSQA